MLIAKSALMRSRKERGMKTENQERRKQELHYGSSQFYSC
jgi:hypothetical protein